MPKVSSSNHVADPGSARSDRREGAGSKRHVLIAGPGRSGTTLLVRLLDALGFDTGADRLRYFEGANAGLEANVLGPEAAHVVKNPSLSWRLREMLESGQLAPERIEWLVIPLRRLDQVAASRVRRTIEQRDLNAPGGLVGTRKPRQQHERLAGLSYGLFETAALYELPLVVLEYPRFARDPAYAFRRLRPLLGDRSEAEFEAAWHAVVDPDLLRDEPVAFPRFADQTAALLRLKRWLGLKLAALRRRAPGPLR
jgi:hypothetical protein